MESRYSTDIHPDLSENAVSALSTSVTPTLDAPETWPPHTHWQWYFTRDIARYKSHRKHSSTLAILLSEQGLWALFQYRIASALYWSQLPRQLKAALRNLTIIWSKLIEIVTGIAIDHKAKIGPGFYIGHYGNIFVGASSIGHTCNISQGVTLGVSGRGERRGVPVIGNRVYIATNAVVAGKVTIGDDVVIAANSLVITDIPAHKTVMGVPARIKSNSGSEEYLEPLEE